jgi:hypothetical protein
LVEDRDLRSRMLSELVNAADSVREANSKLKQELDPEIIWQNFLGVTPFQLAVWSSQRVSYIAFYNSYEGFLVDCIKHAHGLDRLRTSDSGFLDKLRSAFSEDVSGSCWTHNEINTGRLVMHSLSHANGRITADLKKQKHRIAILEGVLQIMPDDNRKLLARLRSGVDALVQVTKQDPRFTANATAPA